jgi:hypothetical protein
VVKTAPESRLHKEAQALQLFQKCGSLRQLVDEIQDPPSLVLEYMDNTVLDLVNQNQLGRVEAKRALKAAAQALVALHDKNIVHTGNAQCPSHRQSSQSSSEHDRLISSPPSQTSNPTTYSPKPPLQVAALRYTNSATSATVPRPTCPPTTETT